MQQVLCTRTLLAAFTRAADFCWLELNLTRKGKYHLLFDLFDGRELQMKLGESPEQPSRQVLPMSCLGGPMMILRHLEIGHPVQNPLNCYADSDRARDCPMHECAPRLNASCSRTFGRSKCISQGLSKRRGSRFSCAVDQHD